MAESPVMPTQRSNRECLANSAVGVPFAGVSSLSSSKIQSRKGKKTTDAETKHKVRTPLDHGLRQKPVDISKCDDVFIIPPGNPLHNAFNRDRVSSVPAGCSRMTNSETHCSTSNKVCGGSEVNPFPELSDATEFSKIQAHKSLSACSNVQKFLKCSRGKGGCTGRT